MFYGFLFFPFSIQVTVDEFGVFDDEKPALSSSFIEEEEEKSPPSPTFGLDIDDILSQVT